MSDDRARLFVALELPDEVRGALVEWRADAVGATTELRFVAAESLHVTLCFLGAVTASEIARIGVAMSAAVAAAAGAPLRLALGAPIWLPRRRPNVLAVRVEDPSGALGTVQSALSRALTEGGWYTPEARPFLAHVTVARVARGGRVKPAELPPAPALPFAGAGIVLFRSHTDPGGARYEALHRAA